MPNPYATATPYEEVVGPYGPVGPSAGYPEAMLPFTNPPGIGQLENRNPELGSADLAMLEAWAQMPESPMGTTVGGASPQGGGVPITYPEGTWAARSEEDRLERQREWAESDDLNPESVADQALLEILGPAIVEGARQNAGFNDVESADWTRPEFSADPYDPSGVANAYDAYIAALQGDSPTDAAYASYISAMEGSGATDEAYNDYLGLLEGMAFEPRTDRIEDIYNLAVDEAARRRGSVESYETTTSARIEADAAVLMDRLDTLHADFDTEVDEIRDDQKDRLAGFKTTRQENIDAAAAKLGDAAATFLISSTKSTDILDAQADRQITHSDRMDRLFAGWELDREMDAHGIVGKERRDLADRVLAMKETIFQFEYGAGKERLEALDAAETAAAENQWELEQLIGSTGLERDLAGIEADQTISEIELRRELAGITSDADIAEKTFERDIAIEEGRKAHEAAVAEARQTFTNDWDRVEALLENPNTAWVFAGMTPQDLLGLTDAQLKMIYDTKLKESEQVEVEPGVFVPMSTYWTTMMGQQGAAPTDQPFYVPSTEHPNVNFEVGETIMGPDGELIVIDPGDWEMAYPYGMPSMEEVNARVGAGG